MLVKEIMKDVITVSPEVTLKEAAKKMAKHNIGSLVVTSDGTSRGKLLGIITERNILECFSESKSYGIKVKEIMSTNIKTIEATADIAEAAALMAKHKIRRLPVVENKKLVGIITATDLIANAEYLDEPFFF